jgi:hypothetical protein
MIDLPPEAIPERKVPVIVRKDYTVYLERTSGLTFIHCDVHSRWSPSVRFDLMHDWQSFKLLHRAPIYALHTPGDRKHEKFLRLFGFSFEGSFTDPAMGPTEIYSI